MEHELFEIVQLANQLEASLKKLGKLDFSKTQFSKVANPPWDYLDQIEVTLRAHTRLFNEFVSDLRIERAIRERVHKRYYVVNSEVNLSLDIMKLLPIKEFKNEFEAFEYAEKQNELAHTSFKKKRIHKLKKYVIHSYNPETDVFDRYTKEQYEDLANRYGAAEHGVFT